MAVPTLLRIPFSHFCRKAEWGLTQAGIPYEAVDVPLWQMKNSWRANPRQGTVPVLRVPEGVLLDSHDILVWADAHRAPDALPLYPDGLRAEVEAWEAWAGEEAGPAVRREAYRALHARPGLGREYGAPRYTRVPLVSRRLLLGVLKHYKARRFEATDPVAVRAAVDRAARQLTLTGTGYLVGKHPTAADHAVAALLEPVRLTPAAHGPAWRLVEAYIQRIKPGQTALTGARPVRKRDWAGFEAAAKTVVTPAQEPAAEPAAAAAR